MASEIYEYRETFRGRASRGRLRTMYRDEDGSYTAETVGVVHTPYGTVEVDADTWWDGVQTILLYTVREGVLYRRWERRRRPLSERGLTTLARRWAHSLVEPDVVAGDRPAHHDRSESDDAGC
jgi:hypothetical protein